MSDQTPEARIASNATRKRVVSTALAPAAEYVCHMYGCPSVGGNGDEDCTCGAVTFLSRVESLEADNERLRATVISMCGQVTSLHMTISDISAAVVEEKRQALAPPAETDR